MKHNKIQRMTFQLLIISIIIGMASFGAANDVKKVILIETMPVPAVLEHSRWFQFQLREMGYEEGKNLQLTILKANGDSQMAQKLLTSELVEGNPDLVVTIAPLASQTAAKLVKNTDVPILFFQVSDPVGAGLVKETNAPTGTNITGKVFTVNRAAKIEMILRLVSQTTVSKPIRFGYIHSTIPIAVGTKLSSVKMGALMHVTPDMEAIGRETALLAHEILKGKDPGTIPVTPPSNFDLGINLTTALKLGIVIPPDILQLAGEHVYR